MAETSGAAGMKHGDAGLDEALALLGQLEGLELRLAQTAGEVELTLLEQATELVEEVSRRLDRHGFVGG